MTFWCSLGAGGWAEGSRGTQPESSWGGLRGIYPDVGYKRHHVSVSPVLACSHTHKHTNSSVNTTETLHTSDQCRQRSGDHQWEAASLCWDEISSVRCLISQAVLSPELHEPELCWNAGCLTEMRAQGPPHCHRTVWEELHVNICKQGTKEWIWILIF